MIRNEKGFTLIEIIAVLVILGVLAAVAIPKYISMMDESRNAAAQGAIAEVKGRCMSYYANQLLAQAPPDVNNVLTSLGATPNLGADFAVGAALAAGSASIAITVSAVKGVNLNPSVVGTWYMPTP